MRRAQERLLLARIRRCRRRRAPRRCWPERVRARQRRLLLRMPRVVILALALALALGRALLPLRLGILLRDLRLALALGLQLVALRLGARRRAQRLHVDLQRGRGRVRARRLVALAQQLRVVCSRICINEAIAQLAVVNENLGDYLRSPHALHSVRAPSGPRRHSGVSRMLHEWHLPGGVARYK